MMRFNSSHAKYTTQNPVSKYLVSRFFFEVRKIISGLDYNTVLDVGCGEGNLLAFLKSTGDNHEYFAVDIDERELEKARKNIPFCHISSGSIHSLPFSDNSKDLVLCTEVLEHVEHPEAGIKELCRVTSRYMVVSVPREPLWRILNILRLHYWGKAGNTPGHINHWSRRSFIEMASRSLRILKVRTPVPWTILLCEKMNGQQ